MIEYSDISLENRPYVVIGAGDKGYTIAIVSQNQPDTAASKTDISVDDRMIATFISHQQQGTVWATTLFVPAARMEKLLDLMAHGGKVLTLNAGNPLQFSLNTAPPAIAEFKTCIEKAKKEGDKFDFDLVPVQGPWGVYSWISAGSLLVGLNFELKKPVCHMLVTRKDYIFDITNGKDGFQTVILSQTQPQTSEKHINFSIDGQIVFSVIVTLGGKVDGRDFAYVAKANISTGQLAKLFDLMRHGGKVLTVDAGEPIQIPLVGSDQAIANWQSCLEKAKTLSNTAKP